MEITYAKLLKTARETALEGAMLVICEENCYKFLVDGFKFAADTIVERKGGAFVVSKSKKHRENTKALAEYYGLMDGLNFMETMDAIYKCFAHVVVVSDRLEITNIRTTDLEDEKGISDWYFNRRGYFTGKKFGL